MSNYDYAVFIGRMQPPHREHIDQICHGMTKAGQVLVVLGSHRAARNIKNPWTAEEREEMIRSCFHKEKQDRLQFIKIRDYYYNNTMWLTDLYNQVTAVTGSGSVCVVGSKKDSSSWYIDALPAHWDRELREPVQIMHATDIRDLYFQGQKEFSKDINMNVADWLQKWARTDTYAELAEEWRFVQEYKEMWSVAPYPVTFVTTDAVVVKNGHVLLIRRKFNPGKGLLALPGGFVNTEQKIIDSAVRELKEETRIGISKSDLSRHIVDRDVFDHPGRSTRGRTITHAFCIKLPDQGYFPRTRGGDDAERVLWMPLADLYRREDEFYEDHCHIIEYFTRKL